MTIPVTSNVQETSLTAEGRLYPNPTMDGRVTVQVPAHLANGMWELYAPDGSRIAHGACEARLSLELPQVRGTYVFKAHGSGEPWVQRVVRR